MKRSLSRLFALILVVCLSWVGFAQPVQAMAKLSGKYNPDVQLTVERLRNAIQLPEDSPDKAATQAEARQLINNFFSRYRKNGDVSKSSSFTTMWTAMNSLAGHYSAYPNRPVPQKLKDRLEVEFKQVEMALNRGD